MHTNYYKIVKQLQSFKIITAAYAATIPITSNVTEFNIVTLAKHRLRAP